jgi:hypothetical protein
VREKSEKSSSTSHFSIIFPPRLRSGMTEANLKFDLHSELALGIIHAIECSPMRDTSNVREMEKKDKTFHMTSHLERQLTLHSN